MVLHAKVIACISRSGYVVPPINYGGFLARVEFVRKQPSRSSSPKEEDDEEGDEDEADNEDNKRGGGGGRRGGGRRKDAGNSSGIR